MLHLQAQLDQAKAKYTGTNTLNISGDNYCFGHDIWCSVIVEINWLLLLALHFVLLLFLNIFLKNCPFFFTYFCETVNLVFALHYSLTYFCKIVNLTSSHFAIAGNIVNINTTTDGSVNVGRSSYRTVERREQRNSVGNSMDIEEAGSKSGGTSISSSHIMDASIENFERTASNSQSNDGDYPAKKMRSNLSLCLNSMSSNTMESAILDLEELVNKIKWLRAVLKCEVPLSGAKRPSWEFLQHHASCI